MKKKLQNNKKTSKNFLALIFFMFLVTPHSYAGFTPKTTYVDIVSQQIKTKTVTVKMSNIDIKDILYEIQKQSSVSFVYDSKELSTLGKLSLNVENVTVEAALNTLLKNTGFDFKVVENGISIYKKQIEQSTQKKSFKGKVIDKSNKSAIVGATVLVAGTANGAITDDKGEFVINNLNVGDMVEVSFMGMKSIVRKIVKEESNLIISLEQDVLAVEDVIVTGVTERKAESYTGSATVLKGEELKRVGSQNVLQSLRNLNATIMFADNLKAGSDPNSLPGMSMRGGTSFPGESVSGDLKGNYENTPNQPLFILDGFEASAERIFDMDMNIVESLTILKDAAAKALYGSKAANGVVIITTKRLNASKPRFTYSGSLELTMPDLSSYDLCNALEKLDVEFAEGIYPDDNKSSLDNYYSLRKKVLDGLDTYWLSKPVRLGYGQKHAVNAELGKDELRTSINVSYYDNAGVMKKSGRETLTGGFNLQYNLKDKLKFQNSTSIVNNKGTNTPYGSFSEYALLNPYYDMYDEFGQLAVNIGNRANPFRDGELNTKSTTDYFQFTNNFSLEWTIIQNLKLRGRFGIDAKSSNADEYYPSTHSRFSKYTEMDRKGSYQANNGKSSKISADIFLSYFKTVNDKHNFLVNAIADMSETISKEVVHYTEGFPSDNMDDIFFAVQYTKDSRPLGFAKMERGLGVSGMFSYTYEDKYLFDLTIRSNGSSMFGSDKRWSMFWSVGLGWNVHKEEFLKDAEWLKQLKLRASVGTTGNQGFQNNKSIAVNSYYTGDRYLGLIGSYAANMENPQLKWEQKMDYNIGFDANLFGVNISADWYQSRTQDLVTQKGIAPSTGYLVVSENLGNVENTGFEIEASYTPILKKNGFFRVNGSIVSQKDKITKISDAMKKFNEDQAKAASESGADVPVPQYQDGKSMHTIWAVHSLGIDPAIGMEAFQRIDGYKTYIWRASDMIDAGVAQERFRGVLGLVGEYKGVGVSVSCRYKWGGQMYNSTLVQKVDNADIKSNFDRRVLTERWSQVNHNAYFKRYKNRIPYDLRNSTYRPGDETSIPELPATKSTDRFVQNLSEFDISSISVYYDFSKRFISKIGFERLKISAMMNEVVKFSSVGIERGTTYPFARSLSIQLSATF